MAGHGDVRDSTAILQQTAVERGMNEVTSCKNSQVYPQGKLYPRKEKEEKEGKRRKRERNDKSISARRVYM